jgi:hypothetical protein
VILVRRTDAGWEETVIVGLEADLPLNAVGLTLPMGALYA